MFVLLYCVVGVGRYNCSGCCELSIGGLSWPSFDFDEPFCLSRAGVSTRSPVGSLKLSTFDLTGVFTLSRKLLLKLLITAGFDVELNSSCRLSVLVRMPGVDGRFGNDLSLKMVGDWVVSVYVFK